jgi:RNA polymerase sigma factor (sigma-70 family)
VAPFLSKSDDELQRLSDDEVIAYVRDARAAGQLGEATRALQILVYGYWNIMQRRVRMKVPEQYVEDVTGEAIISAIRAAFDGESVGEFRSWLRTITDRRIADFHRRTPPPRTTSIHRDDDDGPIIDPAAPSEEGLVEVNDAINRVLGTLRADHRRVVELLVLEDRPTAEALAEIDGMTEDNAHQIARRFRKALRTELERGGDTGADPIG